LSNITDREVIARDRLKNATRIGMVKFGVAWGITAEIQARGK